MSCLHGNCAEYCDLCADIERAWDRGFAVSNHKKDARIADLTTEVADLKSKLSFANAMNADQDKAVSGLSAEVGKYRKALGCIANGKDINAWLADIARNALKEGV